MRSLLSLFVLVLLAATGLQAQEALTPRSVMESEVIHLGRTPALRDLAPKPSTSAAKKAAVKANRPPRNFVGRGVQPGQNPNAQPGLQGYDPVLQGANPYGKMDGDITFLTNIEGISSFSAPHDPSGDVGVDYYIQAVNVTRFQIYNKDGTPASGEISANTLWNSVGRSSAGDPIVLFDQQEQRWIITEFPPGNELLMAVSATSDPFGSWDAYVFGTPSFPDYPKWSIWPNAIVVTTNETGPGEQTVYFIDRAALMDETPGDLVVQRVGVEGVEGNAPGFYVGTPVDWSGVNPPVAGAKPMILRQQDDAWGGVPKDIIDVLEFDIDFADASNTTYTVKALDTAPYDSNPCSENGPGFGCIPQLGSNPIDGLPFVIMNQVHYQNFGDHESIVLNFITDGTAGDKIAGIRWMELRRDQSSAGADSLGWTVYQEGTFAPQDGVNRFMGAIAQDAEGNIALAYTTSSADEYPSLKVTGRFATDPLGEMSQAETTIIEGTGSIGFGNRYGDYAQMSVDPFNGRTFWFTSEYGDETQVTTRIAGFDLKKDTNDLSARTLISPEPITAENGAESTVTVLIKNVGLNTQTGFKVGYSVDNGAAIIEDVPGVTLAPDSTYEHTFATGVDISALGEYRFKAWSDLEIDEFRPNDTVRTVVRTLAAADVTVTEIDAPSTVCGNAAGVLVTIRNSSGRELTEAVITVFLNDEVAKVQNWSGSLAPGEQSTPLVILTNIPDGDYVVRAEATLPNGVADELPGDNFKTTMMTIFSDGERFDFELQLDDYPEETSWQLTNEAGEIVFSGGNYSNSFEVIEEQFCLDPTGCYTLTIFDTFGDGIFDGGGYTVTNSSDEVVAVQTGNFSNVASTDFCASAVCLLEVSSSVTLASGPDAADGTIMLELANTNEDEFSISFDGGPASNQTVFTDLLPGTYTVLVSNGEGCEVEQEIEVGFCTLAATGTAVDSNIIVTIDEGEGPFQFSLDGGNFQNSNEFFDLINGTYTITVRTTQGCEITLEVVVDDPNDVYTASAGQRVIIFPNPTDGVFKVELTGLPNRGTLLPIEIFDAAGRLIQSGNIVRYDDSYYGHFSLVTQPVGTYYLRVKNADINKLLRIVKQ